MTERRLRLSVELLERRLLLAASPPEWLSGDSSGQSDAQQFSSAEVWTDNASLPNGVASGEIVIQADPLSSDFGSDALAFGVSEAAATGEIRGFKWHDFNGDGVWDTDEPPLANWEIFLDLNENGRWDAGEPKTATAANGSYVFTDLAAGTYTVGEVMQEGWEQTFPSADGQPMVARAESVTSFAQYAEQLADGLTTTGSAAPMYGTGSLITQGDEVLQPHSAQSGPLVNLSAFRTDPRFAGVDGQGYSIVVLDTGINLTHPYFGDRIVHYQVFTDEPPGSPDGHGHGSNVTSIAASQSAIHTGVAPGVNIIHLKVLRDSNSGLFAWMEQALQWVIANAAVYNIAAVNMSIGDGGNYNTTHSRYGIGDELAALAALDIVVSTSAGNGFYGAGSVQGVSYPAADPNTLAVGAVYDANIGGFSYGSGAIAYTTAADRITPFSQRHSVLTEAFAPGAAITGASHIGSGTVTFHGTSQASPHVAGAAILAQQIAEQHLGRRLSLGEFRALLQASGVIIYDGDDEDDNVTNTGLSFPRLDMLALGEAILAMGEAPFTHTVTLSAGEVVENINFGNRVSPEIVVTLHSDIVDSSNSQISLREAIMLANSTPEDVTIVLGAGVYRLTRQGANEDAALTGDLDILPGGSVTIVGAGAGQTIIDAAGLGDRVFHVLAGASLSLEGLTVTGGNFAGHGGGILNSGQLQLDEVVVSNNWAWNGAGVRNYGQASILRSTISNNSASNTGGGLSNVGGTLTVSLSSVSGNGAGYGGGMWSDSQTSIVDSTFANNQAGVNGGGISSSGNAQIRIERSTFVGNVGNFGGGMLSNGTATVINSTFSGNDARDGGGGISSAGTLTVHHSTFVGNRADANGNGSGIGGGIRRGDGSITLHHTIVAGNFLGMVGTGAIANDVGTPLATPALAAASSYNLIGDAGSAGGLTHGTGGNIVGNAGEGTINVATVLNTTLAANGGPTRTHALVAGSPAIDAGDPSFNPNTFNPPLSTDQRALNRIRDGLGDGGARIDIGAYELQTPPPVSQIVVTTTGDLVDPNDGVTSLREAIIQANNQNADVTIVLAAGTYTLTRQGANENAALTGDLDILPGGSVTIVGAGAGQTIIDATGLGDRVFDVLAGADLRLDGVAVKGGTAANNHGGGILNNGSLHLNASAVTNNSAEYGGGIRNSGQLTVQGSIVSNNSGRFGGGIRSSGTVTIADSTVSANTATDSGGGVSMFGGAVTITRSTVSGNSAPSGGGLWSNTAAVIVDSTFANNSAVNNGGGITNGSGATLTIERSTFSGNVANAGGGLLNGATANVINSTFSGNDARTDGGGIASAGTLTVQHSTIIGNRADANGNGMGTGGGIHRGGGTITMHHSIVAGNFRGTGNVANDIFPSQTAPALTASSSYNLIGDAGSSGGLTHGAGGNIVGVSGSGTRDVATIVDTTLADNGGPTRTHALVVGSPAIDAGNPSFNPNTFNPPLTTDQRALNRIRDGLGDGVARIDIGAYELQTPPAVSQIVVTTTNDVVNPNDGVTSLREAIIQANRQSGDVTIVLGAGTYTLSIRGNNENAALTGDLDILPGGSVTIVGAGAGQTIIDATGLGDRVFDVLAGADLRLDGVAVKGGTAANNHGGGILNNGSLHLNESAVTNNSAEYGGGIRNSGQLTVQGSIVSNNSGRFGGGIRSSGTVTIAESIISANTATESGGGVSIFGGAVTITGSTVAGNSAGFGGGLWSNASSAIIDTTFIGNETTSNGGAIVQAAGTLTLLRSTLTANKANYGGAVLNTANAIITNTTVSGNEARLGGGGLFSTGTATVSHSTFFGNRADSNGDGEGLGGGIRRNDSGSVTLQNTIVVGNVTGTGTTPSDVSGLVQSTSSYNLIGDANTAGGLTHGSGGNIVGVDVATVLDPLLADNGGPTLTHALLPGSPAVNAGDPSFDPDDFNPSLLFDQRGESFFRVDNGRIDIGAFELQTLPTTVTVVSSQSLSTYGDELFFTATVGADGQTPGGTVQFFVNGTELGSPVMLVGGTAQSITVATLDAGTHAITVQYVPEHGSSLRASTGELVGGQVIDQRPLTVAADARSKVYGTTDPSLTYQITAGSFVGNDAITGVLTRAAGENVGSYAIGQGTLTAGSNYAITFVGANLSITQAPLTVAADAKTKVYGTADPALTYQITAGALVGDDAFTGTPTRVAGENVGNYAIQQGTLTAGGNYAITFVGANLNITPAQLTITADAKSKIYGAADPALTYQITAGALVGDDALTGMLMRVAGENVGSYVIRPGTLTAGNNYAMSFVGASLTITPAPLTVTADARSKVYGTADPALTYQITAGSLVAGDAFTGTPARAAGENVGSYAIGQGTLSAGSNYAITFVGANLSITQAPLTVAADAKTKVYGTGDPALTYQITAGTLVGSDAVTGTPARVAGENVGRYAIGQGTLTAGNNYAITFVGADLSITAAPLTVTADGKSKVYGTSDPALTFQITAGNLVGSDAVTGTPARVAGENVGSYAIGQGTLTAGANYALTFVGANLSITAAPLTVTADGKSKVYGTSDPALTFQITAGSLVAGDAFTGALTRVAGENVGSYAIGQGTLMAGGNYDLTFVGASLSITPAPLTVTADAKSKVYGTADPALTYQVTAGSLVTGDAFTGTPARVAGENVGSYAIGQGTLTAGDNYAIAFVEANLTITQAALTVGGTFTVQDKDFDGTVHATIAENQLTLVGLVGGDDVNLGAVAAFVDAGAGQDKLVHLLNSTLSGNQAANYVIDFTGAPTTTANIHAQVLSIVDDGDNGFVTSGRWTYRTGQGYQNDHHSSGAGTGTNTATWTFSNLPDGTYQVAATWVRHQNRATNAPYTILDGQTALGTVLVNQRVAPQEFSDGGVFWDTLGTFYVTGGQLVVRLSDNANGHVIADAIRIERVTIPNVPQINVSVSETDLVGGSLVNFGTTLVQTPLTRTFTVSNTGRSELVLSEPISVPSGFSIVSSFGNTSLAPGASTTFVLQLDAVTAGTYSGTVHLESNDQQNSPFSFTVSGTVDAALILDNGDNGFVTSGNWTHRTGQGYQNDIHSSNGGTGTAVATWTFSDLPEGSYQVSATWVRHSNRATNAPFTVLDGPTALGTVLVNQRVAPQEFSEGGVFWDTLGTFYVTGGRLVVRLSDNANGHVVADAIRIERIVTPGMPASGFTALTGDLIFDSTAAVPADVNGANTIQIADNTESQSAPDPLSPSDPEVSLGAVTDADLLLPRRPANPQGLHSAAEQGDSLELDDVIHLLAVDTSKLLKKAGK